MDINNDKDVLNETDELSEDNVIEVEAVSENDVNDESRMNQEDLESSNNFAEFDEFEELEDLEGLDELEELEGIPEDTEEETMQNKKTFPIQRPVLIAIIAFVLTAIIAFGSFIVYDIIENNKEKLTIAGVWEPSQGKGSGYYYVFTEDGSFSVNIGGQVLAGSYVLEEVEASAEENTEDSEVYQVVTLTPCVFSDYESQAIVTLSDDKETLSLTFVYSGTVELSRTELPEYKLDATKITHASADEVGLDSLITDNEIIGYWTTSDYTGVKETYIFNADGTGTASDEFVEGGYSITTNFKYTTKDGKIYLSIELFNGSTTDGEISYYTDKGKLILNNLAYDAVN